MEFDVLADRGAYVGDQHQCQGHAIIQVAPEGVQNKECHRPAPPEVPYGGHAMIL